MPSSLDLYRSAKLLIDRYGDSAASYAETRADQHLEKREMEARFVWLGILEAIVWASLAGASRSSC